MRISAPTAWPDCLTPTIASLTVCSRSTGSVSPTGSVAHIAATRLPRAPRSTSARDRHRHHRLEADALGGLAVQPHVVAERAGHHRQHDVVDGPAERVLDRLELPEVRPYPGEPAVGADPHVERARRSGPKPRPGECAHAPERLAGAPGHRPRAAQRRPDAAHDLAGYRRALEQRVGKQLGAARQRAREPRLVGRRHRQRVRRGIEQHGCDVDAGDPVDKGVMRLGQHREAVAGETLDQP